MRKHASSLRVTLSSKYYGNHAYQPQKTNIATEKQINYFDRLMAMAKENGLLNEKLEQVLKRNARTKKGFSHGITALKTILSKANIDIMTGERLPEDSPFYIKTYKIDEKEQNDEQKLD